MSERKIFIRNEIYRVKSELLALEQELEQIEKSELELTPEYARAKELFDAGWRLYEWGAVLTDTTRAVTLFFKSEKKGHWADGANCDTKEAFGILGVEDDFEGLGDTTLSILSDLSEEQEN